MAGNSTGLKMTAWVDDRASGPMKQIGGEARRMGEGFSKSASALRLFEGAAGQMGGGVADAASKVAGLAGMISSGGPFGLAIAGVTLAIGAYTAVLHKVIGEKELLGTEVDKLNEGITDQEKKLKPLIDQHGELSKALAKSAEAQRDWVDEFRAGFDANMANSKRMQENEEKIERQRDERQRKRIAMEKEIAKSAQDRSRSYESALQTVADAEKKSNEKRFDEQASIERDLFKKKLKIEEDELDRKKKNAQDLKEIAASTAGEMLAGAASAALAGNAMARDQALKSILASAARGAAGAAATAAASLPFPANLVVPPIVAASIYGLVSAFSSKFAHGGKVVGGIPGRDSVPIMAQPGETIIPAGLARELSSVMNSNGPRSSSGSTSGGSGGRGGLTINLSSAMLPSPIDQRRTLRQIGKETAKMAKRGQLGAA